MGLSFGWPSCLLCQSWLQSDFLSPLIVTVFSIVLLGEVVNRLRWGGDYWVYRRLNYCETGRQWN